MENVVGYNSDNITNLGSVINGVAENVSITIAEKLNQGFIVPMSENWFMEDAVKFFGKFGEVVGEVQGQVTEAFNNFIAAVNKAGKYWADNTGGGEVPNVQDVSAIDIVSKLRIDQVKPIDGMGNAMIYEEQAYNIANGLAQLESDLEDALGNLGQELDADTSFLGYGQSEAVEECFQKIIKSIKNIFDFLTIGENNIKKQIEEVVKKYQLTAAGVAGGFVGSN